MAEWSFPFTDYDGDRVYSDEDFRQYYRLLFGNGVIATLPIGTALQVTQTTPATMGLEVGAGGAFVQGAGYLSDEALGFAVPVNVSSADRVDSIVVRFDLINRQCAVVYKSGDTSVTRTDNTHELQLCTIAVVRNAASIAQSNITDKRADDTVCGYSSAVGDLNIGDVASQYDQQIMDWFETIQGQLSTDAAASLQLQINSMQTELDSLVDAETIAAYEDAGVVFDD